MLNTRVALELCPVPLFLSREQLPLRELVKRSFLSEGFAWSNGRSFDIVDKGIYVSKEHPRANEVFCHELGHATGRQLKNTLDEEKRAWEIGYSFYVSYFNPSEEQEQQFFDFMVDCLSTYGW